MTTKLVISALGADRPGIVDELSNIIYKHSLNIEDSRMTVLGGEFAILLLVSGEQTSIDAFQTQANDIEQALQMRLLIKVTTEPGPIDNTIPYSEFSCRKEEGMGTSYICHCEECRFSYLP